MLMRHTLLWKYAAYFSGLVSALLILSGGIGGYFSYRESTSALEALQRANQRRPEGKAEREGAGRGDRDHHLRRPPG